MTKLRRNDPPEEDYQQLDIVAINERISQVAKAQDERFNQLEEWLDEQFTAMTKMLADAISSGGAKRRKKSESDKEEGDSKGEVVPADSEKEPAEDHISTGKDKKEDKESKKGQEVEEEEEDKEEIKGKDEGKKVHATKEEAAAKPKKEEKKEAKASTFNADKEKKKPAAKKQRKEKVSEEVKGPTKEELYAAISKLLKEADFNTVTGADIRRQLGAQFKVELRDRKAEVKQIIDDVIDSMVEEDDEHYGS